MSDTIHNTPEAQSISLLLESLDEKVRELKEQLGREQWKVDIACEKIENLEKENKEYLERINLLEKFASYLSENFGRGELSFEELTSKNILDVLKDNQ